MNKPPRIFLTGRPGVGKTTAVLRTIELLRDLPVRGFYTEEVRVAGERIGFDALGLSCGRRAVLARKGVKSELRVGRYGVVLDDFERLAQIELGEAEDGPVLFVIDEVGKMECFSPLFCQLVEAVLQRNAPVLGTVALRAGGFARRIRESPDVSVITVTVQNRDTLPKEIATRIRHWFQEPC